MRDGKKPRSESVAALIRRSMAHPWSFQQVEAALQDHLVRFQVSLAEVDPAAGQADPIGLVLGRRVADLLEIDLVCVDPAHRRAGIARQLISNLIAAEEGSGLREVQLELAASNRPARALYEDLRFMVVGRRSRYYPDGEDALLLSRAVERGAGTENGQKE